MQTNQDFSLIELKMLLQLLEQTEINQSDSSCNDFIVENNKDNLDFLDLYNPQVNENDKLTIYENEIVGLDIAVTQFYIKKIKSILNIKK